MGDGLDELLLALNVDLSPLRSAADEAEQIIDQLERKWAASAQRSTDAITSSSEGQRKVQAAVQDVTKATNIASDATEKQAKATRGVTDALRVEILQHNAKRAAIAAETEELRRNRLEESKRSDGGKESPTRSLLGGVARGVLGEGIPGEVAGGVIAGEGITAIIEGATNAVQRFISHLREISVESGSITELQSVFSKLTNTLGVNGDKAMDELRESTEGLVDKLTLLKVSVAALASPLHITIPALNEMLHSVTVLSEASGHGAQQGIAALLQSITSGRFQQLSFVTGVTSLRELTAQIPPVLQGTARMRREFELVQETLKKRTAFFGDLPDTMEKASQQFDVFGRNLDLAFGQGFNQSEGLKSIREGMKQTGDQMGELTQKATNFGEILGNVIGVVVKVVSSLSTILNSISFEAFAAGVPLIGFAAYALGKAALAAKDHAAAQAADVVASRELNSSVKSLRNSLLEQAGAADVASKATEKLTVTEQLSAAKKPGMFKDAFSSFGRGFKSNFKTAAPGVAEEGAEVAGVAEEGAEVAGVGTAATETGVAVTGLGAGAESLGASLGALALPAAAAGLALGSVALSAKLAKDGAQELVQGSGAVVTWGDVWTTAKNIIVGDLDAIGNFCKRLVSGIADFNDKLGKTIVGLFLMWKDIVLGTLSMIIPGFDFMWGKFAGAATGAFDKVKDEWSKFKTWVTGQADGDGDPNSFKNQLAAETLRATAKAHANAAQKTALIATHYADATVGVTPAEVARRQAAAKIANDNAAAATAAAAGGGLSDKQSQALAKGQISPKELAQLQLDNVDRAVGAVNDAARPATDRLALEKQKSDLAQLNASFGQESGTPRQKEQLAAELEKQKLSAAKLALDNTKSAIAAEQALDSAAYATGEKSFAEHQKTLRDIAQKTYDSQVEEARQTRAATDADVKVQDGLTIEHSVALQRYAESADKMNSAVVNAARVRDTELSKLGMEGRQQDLQVATKDAEDRLKLMQDSISKEAELNKQRFTDAKINPQQYMTSQRDEAQRTAGGTIDAARETYANGPQSPERLKVYQDASREAYQKYQEALTSITESQTQLQIEYIERVYTTQQKAIDAQLSYNKQFGDTHSTSNTNLLKEGQQTVKEELAAYYDAFQTANSDPAQQYSKDWWQIVDNTDAAYNKLQQYNEELRETQALSKPIGDAFSSVGTLLTSMFAQTQEFSIREQATTAARGTTQFSVHRNSLTAVHDVGAGFEAGGKSLAESQDLQKQWKNLTNTKDPQMQKMDDAAAAAQDTFQRSTDAAGSSTDHLTQKFDALGAALDGILKKMNNALASKADTGATFDLNPVAMHSDNSAVMAGAQPFVAMQAVPSMTAGTPGPMDGAQPYVGHQAVESKGTDAIGQFSEKLQIAAQGITSFVGALTSAKSGVGGAIAGGQGGAGLATAVSGALGDTISKGMGQAMPLIGAAVGMLLGGILGAKNAAAQQEMDELKETYKEIDASYTSGNATLATTIQKLQQLIAEAESDMASSKKGGSQFQDLINQYNDQLQQYLDQQASLMRQMDQQVALLTLPNEGADYSGYISSLQSVITQYEQYAGAAQTAAQTMQAQTYLQQSLASYTQQWTQQLQQDQTQAVQDALQLNNLIEQRNELLQQTAQNERNILEQGVLTRQQTFAQSKAQQLAQTQYQANLQLEQMDQQIDLNTAKVDAEKQVFDLATTRIGLEAQLLQLQEAQTGRSMQQIAALANIVTTMNGGVDSNGSLLSTQNNFIQSLLALLSGNSGSLSASAIQGLLSQYNQYASSGLGTNGTGI
jgi:hypothetical protein